MKIANPRADAFVAKPDPAVRAVLLYGPDAGLVRERSDRLVRTVVADASDPFRVAELSAPGLKDNAARLADEAAQISMVGGRRVVRLRGAGDAQAGALEAFLEAPVGDALVVIEAGELAARSKLRVLFEAADNAAAVACYVDDDEALARVVREALRQAGLTIASDAFEYLVSMLGGDRLVTRGELEKLVLYMGPGGAQVRLEDVEAAVGDIAAHALDDAILAAADGDPGAVERALAHAFAAGETPVGAVRAAQRYFQRLHLAAGQIALGEPAERVADNIRPKLFWKMRDRFISQLTKWPVLRAAQALERLTAAEIACKTTGMPDEAIVGRCLLELAGAAARRQRGG